MLRPDGTFSRSPGSLRFAALAALPAPDLGGARGPVRLLLPAVLALFAWGACSTAVLAGSKSQRPFADELVPYAVTRGAITFGAVVNGHGVAVLLDSGSGTSLLDSATAAVLGVAARGPGPELDTGGNRMTSRGSAPLTLSLSNRTRISIEPAQADLGAASKMLGRKIDFVLGSDVLRLATLFVFPGEKTLVFEPQGTTPAGFDRVALSLVERVPVVRVKVDDQSRMGVLDLGASRMIVSPAVFARLAPGRVTDAATADATGRMSVVPVARLTTLGIGDEQESSVPYEVSGLPGDFSKAGDVVIGAQELAPFDFGLDLAGGSLWLKSRTPPAPPNIERAGLELAPDGDAGVVVHVAKGSPAERGGWAAGERVCLIDGRPAAAAASTEWKRGSEGTRVVLKLCDGRTRTIVLHQFY